MTENKTFQMGFEELPEEMKEELTCGYDPDEEEEPKHE